MFTPVNIGGMRLGVGSGAEVAQLNDSTARPVAILVNGMGWSGSSMLVDLLMAHPEVTGVKGEFDDFRRFGLVGDHLTGRISEVFPSRLRTHASRRLASQPFAARAAANAMQRVLAVHLDGIAFGPLSTLLSRVNYPRATRLRFQLLQALEDAFDGAETEDEKLALARDWMSDVLLAYARNKKFVLLDQPLKADTHDKVWPKVFSPCVHFVVFRDPRDQLVDLYRALVAGPAEVHYMAQGLMEQEYGRGRPGIMRFLAHFLRSRFEKQDWRTATSSVPTFGVAFERLAGRAEEVVPRVHAVAGLTRNDDWRHSARFVPRISIGNVGIHRQLLNSEELRLIADLQDRYADWVSGSL